MGILQNIVNTVKKIYNKADTAVGGYLPGGSTPTQVAASKTTPVTPSPAVSTPASTSPFSLTGTYDKATSTYTSPTGQKQSMAATAPAAQAAKQVSSQTSVAQPVSTSASTGATTSVQPVTQTATAPVSSPVSQPSAVQSSGSTNLPSQGQNLVPKVNLQGNVVYEKGPSYFDTYGKFQYDLFSKEGINERMDRYLNAMSNQVEDVMNSPITQGVAVAAVSNPQLISSIGTQLSSVAGYLANSAKIGALAQTPEGVATLASTSPEAAGIVGNVATKAGTVAVNSKTTAQSIGYISKLSTSLGLKPETIGTYLKLGLLAEVGGTAKELVIGGNPETVSKATSFTKDASEVVVKLREAKMDDLADEVVDKIRDIKDDFNTLWPYVFYFGSNSEKNKIEKFKNELNDIILKYDKETKRQLEEIKIQEENKKLIAKEAADKQSAIDAQNKLEESRKYNEEQQQEQRRYNEEQKLEQRRYNEEQATIAEQKANAEALGMEAIATESSGGSNLQFGLLSSSGAKEFVDKDKAAQYYFGKVYEELSEAQKRLLNLMKEQKE